MTKSFIHRTYVLHVQLEQRRMDRKILIYKSVDRYRTVLSPLTSISRFFFFFYDIKVSFNDQGKNKDDFLVFSKIEKKKEKEIFER